MIINVKVRSYALKGFYKSVLVKLDLKLDFSKNIKHTLFLDCSGFCTFIIHVSYSAG